ncbi:MAG: metallophosphoesterase, partial [Parasphingorhabdus sp.]
GDVHAGRRFERGVPLHRRGEREAAQLARLQEELATPNITINITIGDLFDHPHVGYGTVLEVAQAYLNADSAVQYFIMAGNHDLPRNVEVVGAFDVFEKIVAARPNITVVRNPLVWEGIAMFPWEWTRSAEEQVADLDDQEYDVVVGHFDLQSFGGDDSHMVPVNVIPDNVELYSGHWHLPGDYKVSGRTVHCTGSMLPFSHAEDPEGEIYVTLTLDEFNAENPAGFKNKCVRILLKPGEELPVDLDCLALTAKRHVEEEAEKEAEALGDFNWSAILATKIGVLEPHVQEFIHEKIGEYNAAAES